ncbi:MAG: hypothetical protein ACYTAN_05790 [Planctomycetota bacterium]|jgi:hypothetical protein
MCEDLASFKAPGPLEHSATCGRYTLNIYDSMGAEEDAFEILGSGKRVYACKGYRYFPADRYDENPLLAMGKDITGDGKPNLLIFEWTGGAHGWYYYHLFRIAETFAHLQTVELPYGVAQFADLDGRFGLELEARDWTFAYWNCSYAESPAPRLVLRFKGGRYRLAADLMRKPPPEKSALEEAAAVVSESERWFISPPAHRWHTLAGARERLWPGSWKRVGVPIDLWREMLDLIYTGNEKTALEFLDMAWKPGYPGKGGRLKEFRSQLAQSPYWPEIKEMNRDDRAP